jgi:S1-C subfamily serine protease
MSRTAAAAVAAGLASLGSFAQLSWAQVSLSVDCSGVSFSSFSTNPADVVRTSTATINAAGGYQFVFNPIVSGTGLLGSTVGSNKPLGDVLNTFVSGQHRILYGAMRNPGGGVPATLDTEVVGGTFSGITVSLTLQYQILANRTGQVSIRNIQKPLGLGLTVNSGVLVTDVDEKSLGARLGFQAGDIITEVNGETVTSVKQLRQALKSNKGSGARLKIIRDGAREFLLYRNRPE